MSVENNIRLGDAPARIQAAAQVAAYRAAAAIHTHAVSLTPIEQGDLRSSSTVKMDGSAPGDQARAEIAYNMIYASRQHEETGWQHPRGGQSKFLHTALQQKQAEARAIIIYHLKGALNG